jgi:Family of unknown function (DUF6869)
MDKTEKTTLIDAWIKYQIMADSTDRKVRFQAEETCSWARDKMIELAREEPELVWEIILQILDQDPDDFVLVMVIAGPFQDLVDLHSEAFADRIEAQARRSAQFREMLGGLIAIPDGLLRRVGHLMPKRSPPDR